MGAVAYASAIKDARSVESAGWDLLHAIQRGDDVADSVDELEVQAQRAVGTSVHGFESTEPGESDPADLLAMALSKLEMGNTLLAAQTALAGPTGAQQLRSAVQSLGGAADALELQAYASIEEHRFDAVQAKAMCVREAACAALDAMSASAADVATAVLDMTVKPVADRISGLWELLGDQELDIPGRLARWGLLAVRHGLALLVKVIDLGVVERARDQVDEVLARLGHGQDGLLLAAWAIGADSIRDRLAALPLPGDAALTGVADELARLTQGWGKLCQLLRRVAMILAGLAGMLTLLHVVVPQAAVLTAGLLALVIAAVVVLGRDYTGACDLPGPVRGVLLLVTGETRAPEGTDDTH